MPKPSVPRLLRPASRFAHNLALWAGDHLNFYRIHVIVFVFTPLIAAAIFYASNEDVHIKFIDCLFVCVSAMTVTGLTTINISSGTGWQQAILFFLMCIGNISAVSVTMVLIRRHFFRKKFDSMVRNSAKARKRIRDVEEAEARAKEHKWDAIKLQRILHRKPRSHRNGDDDGDDQDGAEDAEDGAGGSHTPSSASDMHEEPAEKKRSARRRQPLRADMVRRMDGPAVLINPMGMPSVAVPEQQRRRGSEPQVEEHSQAHTGSGSGGGSGGGILNLPTDATPSSPTLSAAPQQQQQQQQPSIRISLPSGPTQDLGAFTESPHPLVQEPAQAQESAIAEQVSTTRLQPSSGHWHARFPEGDDQIRTRPRRVSDPARTHARRGSNTESSITTPTSPNVPKSLGRADPFPRAQTVEFAEPRADPRQMEKSQTTGVSSHIGMPSVRSRTTGPGFERTMTGRSMASQYSGTRPRGVPLSRTITSSKQRGFGGFPTPVEIASSLITKAFPKVQERLSRTMTVPRTSTIASTHSLTGAPSFRSAPYLSFDVTVSRNSRFHELTEAQREELGGVEYRAIDMLAKLIPGYWLFMNFFMITLVAPYLASAAAKKYRKNAFDEQEPHAPGTTWFWFFQVISAYSNTGMSLIDTSMAQMQDAYFMLIPMGLLILAGNTAFPIFLRFFIWLVSKVVPSTSRNYETLRFLLDHPRRCFVYLFPSGQTWFLLLVLVIFNTTDWVAFLVIDLGNPTIESLPVGQRILDGLFQSIAVRAAGFQVVSLLLLAPAVQVLYTIMMYLSAFPIALSVRSTNVYEERSLGIYEPAPGEEQEEDMPTKGTARLWGGYLAAHARRQLAFDIWWLAFALWLVCIIERDNIMDPNSNGWFTVFSVIFELTSAYGTVGLSLGTPYDNFSLSGRFRTLSKLVVIAVMLRGRHRGLPVAIDRAVLLPGELDDQDEHETVTRSYVDLSEEPTFTDRADSMPLGGNYDGKDGKASTSRSPSPPQPPSSATGGFPVTPTSAQFASVGSANLAAIREVTPTSTPLMMSRSQSRNDGQAMGAGSEKAHSSYPSARETHEAPASVSSSASASGNGSTSSIKGKGKDRDLSSEDEEVTRRCSGPDGLRVPVTMLESAFAGNISTSSEQGDSAENVRAESSNGTSAGAGARAGAAPAPAVGSGNSNNVEGGRQ